MQSLEIGDLFWRLVACLCRLTGHVWGLLCSNFTCSPILLNDIEHRYVLITGCDSGFGRAAALLLDSHGIPVFAGCITQEGALYLRKNGTERLMTVQLDVTSEDDVNKAVGFIKSNLGEKSCLWGLVNNAGVPGILGLPLESHSISDYETSLKVNLLGALRLTTALLPLLTQSKGRVVNVCCASSRVAIPGNPSYLLSKQALATWSDALRREKSCTGLHVATIYPGAFQTQMNDLDATWRVMKKTWTRSKEFLESSYGDSYTEHAMRAFRRSRDAMPSDVTKVAQVYLHSLFSPNPKTDYNIGNESWTLLFISLLPASVQDRIVVKLFRNPSQRKHFLRDDLQKQEFLMNKLSQH